LEAFRCLLVKNLNHGSSYIVGFALIRCDCVSDRSKVLHTQLELKASLNVTWYMLATWFMLVKFMAKIQKLIIGFGLLTAF